ncbi:MAG TPA: hypothetical protein PKW41_11125 [Clostridia bacterium]|jgi:hypothetical protein|nr:hypothetical protein [Clostridia bacterium]HPK16538.1 hypothetical protein [Clostridia bacterium]
MEKSILISAKACKSISWGLLAFSLILPLTFKSCRSDVFAYLVTAVEIALIAGFGTARVAGRLIAGRLKALYPEWRKEIDKAGFSRFFRAVAPNREKELLAFLRGEPEHEQILAEQAMVRCYAALWVYPPAALVLLAVVWTMFQGSQLS